MSPLTHPPFDDAFILSTTIRYKSKGRLLPKLKKQNEKVAEKCAEAIARFDLASGLSHLITKALMAAYGRLWTFSAADG
jgi:hypothetical protein